MSVVRAVSVMVYVDLCATFVFFLRCGKICLVWKWVIDFLYHDPEKSWDSFGFLRSACLGHKTDGAMSGYCKNCPVWKWVFYSLKVQKLCWRFVCCLWFASNSKYKQDFTDTEEAEVTKEAHVLPDLVFGTHCSNLSHPADGLGLWTPRYPKWQIPVWPPSSSGMRTGDGLCAFRG